MNGWSMSEQTIRPSDRLAKHREEVLAVLVGYGVTNLRVFGSVARGDDKADSDLDLLVDLPPRTGLFMRGHITQDLEDILGCKVDLVQSCEVHERSRVRVLAEACTL